MASAQAMEQHQHPNDGAVFMTVFVSALSGITYVEVYVSWYVQCAKEDSCFVTLVKLLYGSQRSSVLHKRIRNGKIACSKTHEREKRKRVLKSKRLRRVLVERLNSLSLERKRSYLLYLFSPLERNRDKHRRDVHKSNLDVGRPHELHAQEVNNMMACQTDNLGWKLIHESIAEKILCRLR
jgi:hypothetical protein